MRLEQLLENSAESHAAAIAVVDPGARAVSYAEFNRMADDVAQALVAAGVRRSDRVGICAPKNSATLAALFGALKAGAAYVPTDPTAPAERNAYIFGDCSVRVIIAEEALSATLLGALGDGRYQTPQPLRAVAALDGNLVMLIAEAAGETAGARDDLAYILYTSGSTGRPKGVMHNHASALAFIDWCSSEMDPAPHDRFSSHAPFHFDLSIFDIYVPLKHGARVVLLGEALGKQPAGLAQVIAYEQISVWYSTPSILRMLVEFGKLEAHDCAALRTVIFAGEVFPLKHLRALKAHWPQPVYYNLYGPTETNVCTYYRVPDDIPAAREDPFPIGRACSGDLTRVVNGEDIEIAAGAEGELLIAGGSVMLGYWNLPERDAAAFHVGDDGTRWYRTGDVVRADAHGELLYLGRRDRMVKRRGYRVELGEIEAALYQHPSVREAAVLATANAQEELLVCAFLVWSADKPPSTIALKTYCSSKLPLYMVPDQFSLQAELPKTSTDKIDYQRLKDLL